MKKIAFRLAAITACAVLSMAAAPKSTAPAKSPSGDSWARTTAMTADGSHRLGNPEAPIKLVEFVSYTCPHCAHFHKEADPVLRMAMVPKGQISVTVTNFVRNPVDLTVAMLTNCGDPARFFVRHSAFFASQDKWLAKAQATTREQQQRWYQGDFAARMRAIAGDLGFYDQTGAWGLTRAQTDQCLTDKVMLERIKKQQAEVQALGLEGTPSFTLNGQLLDGHDWQTVSKAIVDKQAELRAGNI